jgi:hypothetical protein
MCLHEMTATCETVRVANYHVSMDLGRPILLQGNIADEREHLDLFMERNLLVLLTFSTEVP